MSYHAHQIYCGFLVMVLVVFGFFVVRGAIKYHSPEEVAARAAKKVNPFSPI